MTAPPRYTPPAGVTPLPTLPWLGELSPDEVAGRIERGAILTEQVQQWLDRCKEVAAVALDRAARLRSGEPEGVAMAVDVLWAEAMEFGATVEDCRVTAFGGGEMWLDCKLGCEEIGPFHSDDELRAAAKAHKATHDAEPTFFERRAAADPSVDHSSHSLGWVGRCGECPPERA